MHSTIKKVENERFADLIKNIIKKHNDNNKRNNLIHDILKKVYDKNVYEEKIKPLKGKEFDELTKNLSSGIPVATPVFDGASIDDVTQLL